MKIRKTRIKKTTKANGSVQYVAEYKWGFWWYQFSDSMGPSGNARGAYYDWAERHLLNNKGRFDFCNQEAKAVIDFYIASVNYRNASEIENKVVKIEYEDNP